VILSAYHADEPTLVAAIVKQLVETPDAVHRSARLGDIASKFGPEVRDTLEGVLEPPLELLGRPRSWKAQKLDYLATLSMASPRSIDVAAAEAIHHTGCLLADARRLGMEYVRTIAEVGPSEALWWFEALAETLGVHPVWSRRNMIHELRDLLRSFRIAMR